MSKASPTWWTWVWGSSGSRWWTGKPGMLQSVGSQRVGHDWVIEPKARFRHVLKRTKLEGQKNVFVCKWSTNPSVNWALPACSPSFCPELLLPWLSNANCLENITIAPIASPQVLSAALPSAVQTPFLYHLGVVWSCAKASSATFDKHCSSPTLWRPIQSPFYPGLPLLSPLYLRQFAQTSLKGSVLEVEFTQP